MLLAVGSLLCGRIDMQGTEAYVLEPARRGDVRQSREQLLIKMVQSGLTAELQALIQVGTDVMLVIQGAMPPSIGLENQHWLNPCCKQAQSLTARHC
jgi:hypothetical protein